MRSKIVFIIFIIFILSFTFISTPAYAETATCNDEYQPHYTTTTDTSCNTPLDWDYLFSGVNLDDGSTVADEENVYHRFLFNEAGIIMNGHINSEIRDTIYPYEGHFSGNEETKIEDNSDSKTVDFSYHHTYSSENSEIYQPQTLVTELKIPDDGYVDVNIYDSNNNHLDTVRITDSRRNPDELQRQTKSVELGENADSEYNVDVELHKSSTGESPVIGEGVVLYEEIPPYRYQANSRSKYSDVLDSYHEHLYMNNYNQRQHHNSDETKTTVYSPRLPDDEYNALDIESDLFDGSIFDGIENDARVIRHAYVNIDTIEPSIKVPDGDIGQDWKKIIGDEGEIYVIYDGAIGDVPDDDQDYTGSPSDGDLEWEYSLNDIEYTATLYAEPESGPIELIENKPTTHESGALKFEYQKEWFPEDISELIVEMELTISYLNESEQYYAPEKNCPSDNSGENETYSSYSPSGCSSPSDTYFDHDDLRTEDYDTKVEEENTIRITDEKEVAGFASDDGPSDEDFNVKIANYPDETRTYIERETNNMDSTRWTNMEYTGMVRSNTIDITNDNPTDVISAEQQSIVEHFDINEGENFKITEDMDVYISAWTAGDLGGEIDDIDVLVEDEIITKSNYDSEYNSIEKLHQIADYENISEEVLDNEHINVSFKLNGNVPEDIDNAEVNYKITIDTNEPINHINSRWNYVNYRDYKWDSIEYVDEDCGTNLVFDDGCFDYVNEPPEQNEMMPTQTHLIPTTNSLETNMYSNPHYNVRIHEMAQSQTIHTPIESNYCTPHIEKDDRNICSAYKGYIANEDIERDYRENNFEMNANEDIDREDMTSRQYLDYLFNTDYTVDGLYDFLYEDESHSFEEPQSFEIITDDSVQNLSVAGNVSWNYSEVSTDSLRNAHSTNIRAEIIPPEKLTESYVEEKQAQVPFDNQIKHKDELRDDEVQFRIELTDSNNEPIHTLSRDTDETIEAQRGDIDDMPSFNLDETYLDSLNANINTNEDGVAYVTIELFELDGEYQPARISFDAETDWWEVSEDTRLLASSDVSVLNDEEEISLAQEQGDIESDYSMYDIVSSIVFILWFVLFIVAMFFRVHPYSNTTTLDLFYTITDTVREPIKQSLQYLIMVLIFCFILIIFLQFLSNM